MAKVDLNRERTQGLQRRSVNAVQAGRPAYVAAPALSEDGSNLSQLANSLKGLNPAIQGLVNANATAKLKATDKERERQEALAKRKLGGMTIDDIETQISQGTMAEYESPFFKAAADKIRGIRQAKANSADLNERIAQGDINPLTDDLENILAETAAGHLENSSENYVAGYTATLNKERDKFINAQTAERVTAIETERAEGAHTILRDVIMEGTPEEAVANLQTAKGEIKSSLKLSFGDQDELVLNIAAEVAETGDFKRVEAILKTARKGGNGEDLGSLSSKKGYGVKAEGLIQKAKNIANDTKAEKDYGILMDYDDRIAQGGITHKEIRDDERLTGADKRSLSNKLRAKDESRLREAKAEALEIQKRQATRKIEMYALDAANSGVAFMAEDIEIPVGDTSVKMSAKEIREIGVNSAVDQAVRALGPNPAPGAADREIEKIVMKNATPYKPWTNLMSSVAAVAAHGSPDGDFAPTVKTAFDLYRNIDRTTAEQHIKDDASRDFLRAAYVAQTRMGMSSDEALAFASAARESRIEGQAGIATKAILKSVNKLDMNGIFPGGKGNEQYAGFARRDITEIAVGLASSTGVSPEIALEEATSIYQSTHALVKGNSVKMPAGYDRKTFTKVAEDFIEGWQFRNDPEAILGWGGEVKYDDIHIRSVDGGDRFQVFNGMIPLGRSHTYTMDNLERFAALQKKKADDEKMTKATTKAKKLKKHRDFVAEHTPDPNSQSNIPALRSIR